MGTERPIQSGRGGQLDSVLPMWAEDRVTTAYQRFHSTAVTFFRPTIEALLAEGQVRSGMHVLDIGTGTGIPALAVAEAVGRTGHVVASDPSPAMLAAARQNAASAGLGNVSFTIAVAESLPFRDRTFDRVLSHAGIMFAADLDRALSEIRRVTRPGGRAAFLGWGPAEQNPWLTGFWDTVRSYRERLQPPDHGDTNGVVTTRRDPDPRTPFRFAATGSLSEVLRGGFDAVRESQRSIVLHIAGRGEALLRFFLTASGFDQELPIELVPRFREAVLTTYGAYSDHGRVGLPASIVIGSGRVASRPGARE